MVLKALAVILVLLGAVFVGLYLIPVGEAQEIQGVDVDVWWTECTVVATGFTQCRDQPRNLFHIFTQEVQFNIQPSQTFVERSYTLNIAFPEGAQRVKSLEATATVTGSSSQLPFQKIVLVEQDLIFAETPAVARTLTSSAITVTAQDIARQFPLRDKFTVILEIAATVKPTLSIFPEPSIELCGVTPLPLCNPAPFDASRTLTVQKYSSTLKADDDGLKVQY